MNTPHGQQPYQQNPSQYGPPPQQGPPQQYGPPQPQYGAPSQNGPPQQYGAPQYGPPQPQYGAPQYGPPQQYGAPQYGPPQPQYGAPSEGIAVTTQFFPLAWLFYFLKPKIFVDGIEMPPAPWGRTVVPARPGQHNVHVHTPYFLPPRLGPADTTAFVQPGQIAELEYKAPMWSYSAGSLGIGPQKYNGVGITIAVSVIPLALVVLYMIVAIASFR